MVETRWFKTTLNLKPKGKGIGLLLKNVRLFLRACSRRDEEGSGKLKGRLLKELEEKGLGEERARVTALFKICCNFIEHGWGVRVQERELQIARPIRERGAQKEYKRQVQRTLHVERNRSLTEPAAAAFIREMETRKLTKAGWVSIFNLMRDGRELAKALCGRKDKNSIEELKTVMVPYLQFVETDERDREKAFCQETGLRLVDIWRYFRMTWSNKYEPVPGRKMMILVRDRAAPFHPVIGIAALSSAIPKLMVRDKWLGWVPEAVWDRINNECSEEWARWIHSNWNALLKELFIDDFIEEKVLSIRDISCPSKEAIERLRKEGQLHRETHHLNTRKSDFEALGKRGNDHWRNVARTLLYRSKRALALSDLLEMKRVFRESQFDNPSKESLASFLKSPRARWVVVAMAKAMKGRSMGISIMDISVCGALAPYADLLCGKLVAMLLTSSEVVEQYRDRYRDNDSIIASSMAGRVIRRDPVLVFLGTTSLYGVSSSQYNRITIPANRVVPKKEGEIRYRELGTSGGFGTFHISSESIEAMGVVLAQAKGGRRVNSIFGEGASPRLRKVREGLDELGLPSDEILKHGDERIVYGVNLVANPGDYLLGFTDKPEYILNGDGKRISDRIVDWWMERWLLNRAKNEEILSRVEQHDLTYPIRHGARAPQTEVFSGQLEF